MIGVVVNGCQSLQPENSQVCDIDDKQSLHFDWLPGVLRSELLISEKELFADLDKSQHSFLRNLLTDTTMNDKYELDGIQRSDADVFDDTAVSQVDSNPVESAKLAKQSYAQIVSTESKTVGKPCGLIGKGTERGRLRCQISRTSSSVIDDSTDTPLKTPAGFYDLACATGCLSIPPLFDYSSGLFTNPCHDSDASHLFTDNSMLCSISEDEKWSEGSEISSVDIDASSTSALSPVDFTKDCMMSITEDEEEQEERVVLSVVQNVLSDEAGTLNEHVDESMEGDICSDDHQHSPDTSSSENSTVDDSQLPPSTDASKLNPLARPFTCLPRMPVQPMPVVFTPAMPTVVVPVKFVYTKLVPVGKSKSPSSKHLEKNSAHWSRTPVVSSNTPNSSSRAWCPNYSVVPSGYNAGMYYYSPWQPMYYFGRSVVPVGQVRSSVAPAHHHMRSRSKKEVSKDEATS